MNGPEDAAVEVLGSYVDAASALQGLTIDGAWRAGVVANLQTIARAADLVSSFRLDDDAEPAPVFTP